MMLFLLFVSGMSGAVAHKLSSWELKLDELPMMKPVAGEAQQIMTTHPSEETLIDIAYDVFNASPETTNCQACWSRAVELRKHLRPTIKMLRHWLDEDCQRLYKKLNSVHEEVCVAKQLSHPELCDERRFEIRMSVVRGESLSKICRQECEKELTRKYV